MKFVDFFVNAVLLVLFCLVILGVIFIGRHIFFTGEESDFCELVFPSESEGSSAWSDGIALVEDGFVRCCRYVYIDHVRETECEVFRYYGGES